MSNESNRGATQVDQGWRFEREKEVQTSTQVDQGWRMEQAGKQATQVDQGWRMEQSGKQATQVDQGWRMEQSGKQATQVDQGWRREAVGMFDPQKMTGAAVANAFLKIEDFREAVAKLPSLTTTENNVYPIKKMLSSAGGESVILLCSNPDGQDVVAKVYYEPVNGVDSSVSARTHVLEFMGTEAGKKYTLAVEEIGLIEEFGESKYYFEIMPYCEDGDVSNDGAYDFDDLVGVIEQLNEGLHSLHKAGILHRDIKPENVYKTKNGVVLGDFGIARLANLKGTSTNKGSYGYQAPETQIAVSAQKAVFFFDERCDYYSLGVTIATLYEGHFVYDNMSVDMVTKSYQKGKVPLTRVDEHREEIENLIVGLCKYDPQYRFGYEDVKKWLLNHNYTGGGIEEEWSKEFRMLGDKYHDEAAMFKGITKDIDHWNEGKNMLYSKYFEQFFMSFRTDLARAAQVADELYRADDSDKGLAIFLKSLYAPGPIVWKGYTFNSLSELAGRMVTAKNPVAYSELLQKKCISHWLANTEGISVDEETKELVDTIEAYSLREPEIACYWFGNSFATEKMVEINGKKVSTIQELLDAMFTSANDFYQMDAFEKLYDPKTGADLYGFLFSFGFQKMIDGQKGDLNKCDSFNKTALLFAMLDNIAAKSNADTTLLRNFFVEYGPVGIATYTKKLVAQGNNKVYMALDSDGKRLLSQIAEFNEPANGNVDELFRAYTPLYELVQRMQRILIENPYCITTGLYENSGIICKNLVGCFGFEIFARKSPLGFGALIEASKGGAK